MTVMDQIRKLDEQKLQLLAGAKKDALEAVQKGIDELRELGFNYRLVTGAESGGMVGNGRRSDIGRSGNGKRRTGIREDVLRVVGEHGEGVSRAKVLELMDAKGEKSAEQSISNALAALKKAGTLVQANGLYKSA